MTDTFGIPPESAATWNAGQLVRRGALLIWRDGGGIAGHLQETGARLALDGVSGLLGSLLAPVAATMALSLAGIGVTAVFTAMILRRIEVVRAGIADLGHRTADLPRQIAADRRRERMEEILDTAAHLLGRLETASVRRDPRPMLHDAETALDATFDGFANGLARLHRLPDVTADDLALLIRGLGVSGGRRCGCCSCSTNPMPPSRSRGGKRCASATLRERCPPDVLADAQPGTDPANGEALAGGLIETGRRLASIPPLFGSLNAAGIAPRDWLQQAEEAEAPCLLLPGPAAPGPG